MRAVILHLFETFRTSSFETRGITRYVNDGVFDESVHFEVCKVVASLTSVEGFRCQGTMYYRHRR